jgi:hypothetical protein
MSDARTPDMTAALLGDGWCDVTRDHRVRRAIAPWRHDGTARELARPALDDADLYDDFEFEDEPTHADALIDHQFFLLDDGVDRVEAAWLAARARRPRASGARAWRAADTAVLLPRRRRARRRCWPAIAAAAIVVTALAVIAVG